MTGDRSIALEGLLGNPPARSAAWRSATGVLDRLAALEHRVAVLEKLNDSPDDEGWVRRLVYAREKGFSVRTIERYVREGRLEKRKEPGTNRVFVRRAARPPRSPRQRGQRPGDDPSGGQRAAPRPANGAPGAAVPDTLG